VIFWDKASAIIITKYFQLFDDYLFVMKSYKNVNLPLFFTIYY